MKNKLEQILLSIVLGLAVLLGLSFWLNTIFNFNIFCAAHWDEFAKLQASHTPINIGFYTSFMVAILILVIGLYLIYRQTNHQPHEKKQKTIPHKENIVINPTITEPEIKKEEKIPETTINLNRPPRLNLPRNMTQIVEKNHIQQETKKQPQTSENPYNSTISEIFSDAGYLIKKKPTISGFVPNLFAIGNNEILWIGGVDCDSDRMIAAIEKLQSVFQETLEDIQININAFILDTMNKQPENTDILTFKDIDELKEFITEHPADKIEETDKDNFDAYSEYIDTIIQYIKNI